MTTPRNHTEKEDYDPVLLGLTPKDNDDLAKLQAQVSLLLGAYHPTVCKALLHNLAAMYGYKLQRRLFW